MAASTAPEAIHLYRSILRASDYLPDAHVRQYVRSTTRQRFSRTRTRYEGTASWDPSRASALEKTALRKGRRQLHILERASNGHIASLVKILRLTYGREGRRRRELLAKLMMPAEGEVDVSQDFTAKAMMLPAKELAAPVHDIIQPRSARVRALVKSQHKQSLPHHDGKKIRSTFPQIPETNSWGRPMPLKRVANATRKFWAKTADTLLPPLPRTTWERLRDLSTGARPWEPPLPRRTKVGSWPCELDLLHPRNLNVPIGTALTFQKASNNTSQSSPITARKMMRLWAQIWSCSPLLEQDAQTGQYTVEWGMSYSAAARGVVTAPGPEDLVLFDGLDDSARDDSPSRKNTSSPDAS